MGNTVGSPGALGNGMSLLDILAEDATGLTSPSITSSPRAALHGIGTTRSFQTRLSSKSLHAGDCSFRSLANVVGPAIPKPFACDVNSRYRRERRIGIGQYGVIYLCEDLETKEKVACKTIYRRKLLVESDYEDLKREVAVMWKLNGHSNIVALKAVYEDPQAVHLIIEYCEGGDLFELIEEQNNKAMKEADAARIFIKIVEVIRHCHANGVMHRDLKPENIFLRRKDVAKVGDFGLSVFFTPGERFHERVGTPFYVAPEVLKKDYGPEVDIWSAGVILYVLLCGAPPFAGENYEEMEEALKTPYINFERQPWAKVSQTAKKLIRKMLEPDPALRCTADQVLEHPWFSEALTPAPGVGIALPKRARPYCMMSELKKKALKVIAEKITEEDLRSLGDVLHVMDADNDGLITFDELKEGFKNIDVEISETAVRELLEAADAEGKGGINYKEFVAATMDLHAIEGGKYLQDAFKQLEWEESGFINIMEMEEVMNSCSEESFLEHTLEESEKSKAQQLDAKDGRLAYDDFVKVISGPGWRRQQDRASHRERLLGLSSSPVEKVLQIPLTGLPSSGISALPSPASQCKEAAPTGNVDDALPQTHLRIRVPPRTSRLMPDHPAAPEEEQAPQFHLRPLTSPWRRREDEDQWDPFRCSSAKAERVCSQLDDDFLQEAQRLSCPPAAAIRLRTMPMRKRVPEGDQWDPFGCARSPAGSGSPFALRWTNSPKSAKSVGASESWRDREFPCAKDWDAGTPRKREWDGTPRCGEGAINIMTPRYDTPRYYVPAVYTVS
ncbi:hypothetical protein CBR_g24281 [Chara braunii]|uniref:Calcium-dependent protein kinase n=1 Tax=Chara braunii TaxID=69332 RepID=A0A388JM88_CHABU|nr:hypothetical protein CBR_g24281 [Chara braunii]|eukprot:GBG58929.1 hypothetical protein CBR_g24281 [Chara braunii]